MFLKGAAAADEKWVYVDERIEGGKEQNMKQSARMHVVK